MPFYPEFPALPASAALWFLPVLLPICLLVAWNDMRTLKIRNLATDGMLLAYLVLGVLALPFDQYLWHWSHFALMLLVGIILNAAGVMGGGDSKFIASAAPFVAAADLLLMLILLAAALPASFLAHRVAKHTALRQLVPDWASWQSGKRFPMGLPLGGALAGYLLLVLILR